MQARPVDLDTLDPQGGDPPQLPLADPALQQAARVLIVGERRLQLAPALDLTGQGASRRLVRQEAVQRLLQRLS
jgi:hypothetical protein